MKIKKRTLKLAVILIVILLAAGFAYNYYNSQSKKPVYEFKENFFSYSENRGKPVYAKIFVADKGSYDLYKVVFETRQLITSEIKIYGLLLMPKSNSAVPGVVLLPGGGVTKDDELATAEKIVEMGYAVLTIDQRGVGETKGYSLSFEDDYGVFSRGFEPMHHLAVFDALKAFDVMADTKGIDKSKIAIVGESMGGRYGLIAAAIEKRVRGFIGISTAGFHFKADGNSYAPYLLSVDPDNYIAKISPRPLFMLHCANDTVAKIDDAKITFGIAGEPKEFLTFENCGHGYSSGMHDSLKTSLEKVFK